MLSGPSVYCRASLISLKFVFKEPIIPASANKGVFLLAPLVTGALGDLRLGGDPDQPGLGRWPNLNVGILYIFAISSLGVYGVIMAGLGFELEIPISGRVALGRPDGVL